MKETTVNVLYKSVDGAHFFVSDDEKALGLCVAHNDPVKAYHAVGIALAKLYKENHGIEATFYPSLSVQAFLSWLEDRSDESLMTPVPGTAGLMPWSRAEAA